MIAESPGTLVLLLAVLTLLGAVMGYCIALIFAKRAARKAIESALLEAGQHRFAAEPDLQAVRYNPAQRRARHGKKSDSESRVNREKSLEKHARLQAERIQNLEGQLVSLEEQQKHLKSEIASYKTSTNHKLEQARGKMGGRADLDSLPTLSRKVVSDDAPERARALHPISAKGASDSAKVQRGVLKMPLSREIDIPALAESELPDSADELDFDVSDAPGNGARGRG